MGTSMLMFDAWCLLYLLRWNYLCDVLFTKDTGRYSLCFRTIAGIPTWGCQLWSEWTQRHSNEMGEHWRTLNEDTKYLKILHQGTVNNRTQQNYCVLTTMYDDCFHYVWWLFTLNCNTELMFFLIIKPFGEFISRQMLWELIFFFVLENREMGVRQGQIHGVGPMGWPAKPWMFLILFLSFSCVFAKLFPVCGFLFRIDLEGHRVVA